MHFPEQSHSSKRRSLLVLLLCACVGTSTLAHAEWPERPVRLIVNFAAGGAAVGGDRSQYRAEDDRSGPV